jgi:8-oxo-dGTP diphosphatase
MIDVCCAIIRNVENEVLVVQNGEQDDHAFKWEFPGGKLKEGESREECIIREIQEELLMDIVICGRLDPVIHDYGHRKIRLFPFVCDTLDELPVLTEHIDFRWCIREELGLLDFSGADLHVLEQYSGGACGSFSGVPHEYTGSTEAVSDKEIKKMISSISAAREAGWLAAGAPDNPELVLKLLEYSLSDDPKLSFRASWTLSKIFDKNPEAVIPRIPDMIEALDKTDHEGTRRSFLRIISLSDPALLSLKHHGMLADHCFKALNSKLSAVAVKSYSMEIIYRLTIIYPELAGELTASINMLSGESRAGIIARGKVILGKLQKIAPDQKT